MIAESFPLHLDLAASPAAPPAFVFFRAFVQPACSNSYASGW